MAKKTETEPTRQLKSITIKELIDDYIYRIDLDADYQRDKIWSRRNQEELLDSIVKNIDIPKLYLAEVKNNETFDYECIDGKQRMATLLDFFKPERPADNPLTLRIAGGKYTYEELREDLPHLADRMDAFELTFVIYSSNLEEEFIREIFRRLQLGVRLNSGELLKTHTGAMRDFVYEEMGKDIPFLRRTHLSEKRFSRQFTLAQICINSFSRNDSGEFVRARYDDLEDFFKDKFALVKKDANFVRIRQVLEIMEDKFGERADAISSRAVAVSAYLYAEDLYVSKKSRLIAQFSNFYAQLLADIKENLTLLARFEPPTNTIILEGFQKYISQASVESYAIKRRDLFLDKAFMYYLSPKTKGRIVGSKP